MPLVAKSTGSDFEPIPVGMHAAVCYGVVDLGTQPAFGNFPARHKVLFLFELPEERGDFERDGKRVNLPRAVSATFTLSLHPKGNLRPALVGWRGRDFTPQEEEGFDVMNVAGANAYLNITHTPGKGKNANRLYADIKAICPMPKGAPRRTAETPLLKFSLSDSPPATVPVKPANMPDWVWARNTQSDEYILRAQGNGQPQPTADQEANLGGPESEDIPF